MAYTRTTWQNYPGNTPVNATRLNNVELGLVDAHNFSVICTSTTRPASPFAGQQIYETDTGYARVYNGSLWRQASLPPTVTSLPSSPVDGDEIVYTANGTLGIRWHFKYRSASASSYKWEFVGGAPIRAETDSGTWTAWTAYASNTHVSTGTQITVPLAGDYQCTGEVHSWCSSLSSILLVRSDTGYGNTWGNYHAAKYDSEVQAFESLASTRTITCLASSIVHIRIACSNVAQPAYLNNGQIWAIPVRVG